MNLLAFRSPDRIYYSDSCPAGLGGYSDQGFAWRFAIPDELLFRASNNLLEFLAAVINADSLSSYPSWRDIESVDMQSPKLSVNIVEPSFLHGSFQEGNGNDQEEMGGYLEVEIPYKRWPCRNSHSDIFTDFLHHTQCPSCN